jgi:hypothetical protein
VTYWACTEKHALTLTYVCGWVCARVCEGGGLVVLGRRIKRGKRYADGGWRDGRTDWGIHFFSFGPRTVHIRVGVRVKKCV